MATNTNYRPFFLLYDNYLLFNRIFCTDNLERFDITKTVFKKSFFTWLFFWYLCLIIEFRRTDCPIW